MMAAKRTNRTLVALGLLGALTLAACSGDDTTNSLAGNPTPGPATEASPAGADTAPEATDGDAGTAAAPNADAATPTGPSAARPGRHRREVRHLPDGAEVGVGRRHPRRRSRPGELFRQVCAGGQPRTPSPPPGRPPHPVHPRPAAAERPQSA